MSLNVLKKRLEVLEADAAMKRDDGSGGGVLLSPADVALLMIERFMISGDSPEDPDKIARIDALLKSHHRACAQQRPRQMPPDIMEAAMRDAVGREANPDYRRERLVTLLEAAT